MNQNTELWFNLIMIKNKYQLIETVSAKSKRKFGELNDSKWSFL